MDNNVLTENAYNFILSEILTGHIKPGERIREDLIAEKLGISRTPVREATNQLCQNGFINYVKRKGLYCIKIDKEELENLLELRQVLEEFSYITCASKAAPEDIEALRKEISFFRALSEAEQAEKHASLDIHFHVHAAEITGSRQLVKYIQEVETLLLIVRKNLNEAYNQKEVIALSWDLHERLVDAIEKKDMDQIRHLNAEHIQLMRKTQLNPNYT